MICFEARVGTRTCNQAGIRRSRRSRKSIWYRQLVTLLSRRSANQSDFGSSLSYVVGAWLLNSAPVVRHHSRKWRHLPVRRYMHFRGCRARIDPLALGFTTINQGESVPRGWGGCGVPRIQHRSTRNKLGLVSGRIGVDPRGSGTWRCRLFHDLDHSLEPEDVAGLGRAVPDPWSQLGSPEQIQPLA